MRLNTQPERATPKGLQIVPEGQVWRAVWAMGRPLRALVPMPR